MDRNTHIGIFDSGVGGLSVLRALKNELPEESFIYLADSANAPYGKLQPERIIDLARKNTEFLLKKNVKLVVLACNTATGIAIKNLRKSFHLPFVGMEPAVKPAAANSLSRKIGVLATARTFEADHFNETVNRFADGVEVFVKVDDGLVELIEAGEAGSWQTERLLSSYLDPLIDSGIDQLVLGCTHYPFLMPLLRKLLPDTITIHDPAPAVARQVRRILEKNNGSVKTPKSLEDQYYSTGNRTILDLMLDTLDD